MNKKKILLIIPIIILLMVILLFNNIIVEKFENKLFPTIKERIDKNDSFMILVTNSNPDESLDSFCLHCNNTLNFINYNKELYGLDIVTYDKYKYSDEDYNNVEDYLKLEKNFIVAPAIIYIKDGSWVAIENEIRTEDSFKKYLVDYKLIEDKELEKEINLNTKEEFDKIYSKDEKSIVILYSFNEDINKIRKKIHELSLKNNFTYYITCINLVSNREIQILLIDKYEENFKTPSIVIIGNNKIVDYTSSNKDEEIKDFILKNINK